MLNQLYIDEFIKNALKEDMPFGDITTMCLVNGSDVSRGNIMAKQDGVLAGLDVCKRVFSILDEHISFNCNKEDGETIKKGEIIAWIEGNSQALLKGERTALNILQRMSGIATMTRQFVERIEGTNACIADTRKTMPGMRMLDKYAVKAGGGQNHRFSLSDGVLIKDNHIKAAGGIEKAVKLARMNMPHTIKIEVETETMEQVWQALEAGADIIMLDNMDLDTMKEAVELIKHRALVEASGNVTLENVRDIALTGVDIISVGMLTHSVKALDISLRFV